MNVEFDRPIIMAMDVVSIDDRSSSMHMTVSIKINHFQHEISYAGAMWVSFDNWDSFNRVLRSSEGDALLEDISGYFKLRISRMDGKIIFLWSLSKKDLEEGRGSDICFCSDIDQDVFEKIRSQFLNFPSWW